MRFLSINFPLFDSAYIKGKGNTLILQNP